MQFIRNPGQANETRLGLTTSGTPLANGDVLRVMTPGGGGYGEPSRRDRAAVKRDLREGKITAEAAREITGSSDCASQINSGSRSRTADRITL